MTKAELDNRKILPLEDSWYRRVKEKLDGIAKPLDGLGKFEHLIAQIGAIEKTTRISIQKKAVLVMCADNGVVEEQVSQSGKEVTLAVAKAMGVNNSSVGKMAAVAGVDECLSNYKIPEAAKYLQEFVDDLSNWYVRRSRERFWAKGMEQDKINAYMTLYTALVTISKAAAPMIPFMTEDIYRNLVCSIDKSAPESIHLCDYPVVDEKLIDKKLEADMDEVLKVVVLGRACRNEANIKNRQPIGKMFVKAPEKLDEFYVDIIADELNVKEVEFTDDVSHYTTYKFKPQLRTVGPKYGKYLGQIKAVLAELDGHKAMEELNSTGSLKLDSISDEVVLSKEDLLIEMTQMEGYVTQSDNNITVVLDTNLTPELIEEGFVREIISKIQTMRKDAGFEVMDHIAVTYEADEKLSNVFEKFGDEIKTEVLAVSIKSGELKGYEKDWKINGEAVKLAVEKQ